MTPTTARTPASSTLSRTRVIAVLRAQRAGDYRPVIDALRQGDVVSIEITLSTPGAIDEIAALRTEFGTSIEIGVGTITTVQQAQAALDAGAEFLVTPITLETVIRLALDHGTPVFPGGLTPTELFTGWDAGATAVKVFPASTVGAGYVSQLRGPFPDLQVVPSGGVGIDDVAGWLRAGALAVSLGGPLLGDAFTGGDLTQLTKRAQRVRRLVDEEAHRT